jgi:tetratricopeptide (TPR) repeat protein
MAALWSRYLRLIDSPFHQVVEQLESPPPEWALLAYRTALTLFIALILFNMLDWAWRKIKKLREGKSLAGDLLREEKEQEVFVDTLEAAAHLERTTETLKRQKNFQRLGEVYASVNRPRESAKWYVKARNYEAAAEEWAKAGETARAAKMMQKAGDHIQAAYFFSQVNEHKAAARAYEQANDPGEAALSWLRARKYKQAIHAFRRYFESTQDPVERQVDVAQGLYDLLRDPPPKLPLTEEDEDFLLRAVAERFEQAKRYDIAAELFAKQDDPARAGQVYLLAGNLEKAAEMLKAAGQDAEAARVGGRYYAKLGQWREAGVAFAGGGDYMSAGQAFQKAGDLIRAADCYEKAGAHHRAGLANAQTGRYEHAIRNLQKVPEDAKEFDLSRALLGRCFYELHDYAHCAAALDNHLTGKRVDSTTVEYFYMLALAYEQMGKLQDSQAILYKIRTVDVDFRDVKDRLSNIESRISLQLDEQGQPAAHKASVRPADATHVMAMVEDNLGKRYNLERELGRGGMGVVYLARDAQLDRPVALKFLGSLVDQSEEYRKRFIREAKAAAKVNHPNIVSIYDISATEGKSYIAMEYVDGVNLHRYVAEKGALTSRETIAIARQVCSALAAIHQAGVVHRDLKPDNVLIAKGGLVKLSDFGLAKAEGMRLTGTNVIMGTPSFMSPEQAQGKPADARSDIYSLGLVLHQMLTGKIFFNNGEVMKRQIEETPPPPGQLTPGVPSALDEVVMRCLQKNPAERYQSAQEVLAALRALAT